MEPEWAKVAAGSSSSEIESPTGVIGGGRIVRFFRKVKAFVARGSGL
jgi:hypothetical protein